MSQGPEHPRIEHQAGHGPVGHQLDLCAKLGRAAEGARHVQPKAGVGLPLQAPLQLFDRDRLRLGALEKGAHVDAGKGKSTGHKPNTMPSEVRVNTSGVYSLRKKSADPKIMDTDPKPTDIWPKRAIFRQDLEEYIALSNANRPAGAPKMTHNTFAEKIGLKLTSFHNNLYTPTKQLQLPALQEASRLMRKDLNRWIDNPGADLSGVDVSSMTPHGRLFTEMVVRDLQDRALSDEDRRYIAELAAREVVRISTLLTRTPRPEDPDRPFVKSGTDSGPEGSPARRAPKK